MVSGPSLWHDFNLGFSNQRFLTPFFTLIYLRGEMLRTVWGRTALLAGDRPYYAESAEFHPARAY